MDVASHCLSQILRELQLISLVSVLSFIINYLKGIEDLHSTSQNIE